MKGWSAKHHDYRKALLDEMAELPAKKTKRPSSRRGGPKNSSLLRCLAGDVSSIGWQPIPPANRRTTRRRPRRSKFADGYAAFFDKKIKQGRCSSCHTYSGDGGSEGPDLTGYGSADWVRLMIVAPAHPMRHGTKNAMTAFRNDQGPGAEILLHELAQVAGDKYSPLVRRGSRVDHSLHAA